jgi:PilZ domain
MHVLVLSADPWLVSTLTNVFREFGIQTQPMDDHRRASHQLNCAKYAGLVLDFDTVPSACPVIASMCESRTNKTAVVFAVATKIHYIEKALVGRVHFVLRRPIHPQAIRKTLRSAYDLLSGKHRSDFRHPAKLAVSLTALASEAAVEGSTLNVSSHGIAVVTPTQLQLAEAMHIALILPDGFTVHATGVVIWSDQHGKGGWHFQCTRPEMREKLDAWLDAQLALANPRGLFEIELATKHIGPPES